MKKILTLLFAASALILSACGGTPTPADPHQITEDNFNKEIINVGFSDYTANGKIIFDGQATYQGETRHIETVVEMQSGKYHIVQKVGDESHESYNYAELDGGKVLTYEYINQGGEWVKSTGVEGRNLYLEIRRSLSLYSPAYSSFTYDKESSSYKCAEANITADGMDMVLKNVVYKFENNKLVSFSYENRYAGGAIVAEGTISEINAVSFDLPDGYRPKPAVIPTGKVSKDIFDAVVTNLKESTRTSGSSTVSVVLKQNGQTTNNDSGNYTYTKVDGSWTKEGTGSGAAAQMSTAYNHTVGRYVTFLNSYVKYMDSYDMVFEITSNSYKATLTGKLDYGKMYGRGWNGLLDLVFELEWEETGMLTYWHFTLNGNVTNGSTTIRYQEEDTIRASWN